MQQLTNNAYFGNQDLHTFVQNDDGEEQVTTFVEVDGQPVLVLEGSEQLYEFKMQVDDILKRIAQIVVRSRKRREKRRNLNEGAETFASAAAIIEAHAGERLKKNKRNQSDRARKGDGKASTGA